MYTVYSLADANRHLYLKFRDKLIKLGGRPAKHDQGIFTWSKNNVTIKIVVCFVDDVPWGSNQRFQIIKNKLRNILCRTLKSV